MISVLIDEDWTAKVFLHILYSILGWLAYSVFCIQICDFGCAKFHEQTARQTQLGTPRYVAPEVCKVSINIIIIAEIHHCSIGDQSGRYISLL